MGITKKGLKMTISKCFTKLNIEKSESIVTEIRGEHKITNGYIFIDDLDNDRIILTWQNDEFTLEQKLEKVKKMYKTLDRYGFSDHALLNNQKAEIYLINFV